MGVRALVVAISLASAASGAPAHAAENEFLGLLRARDLTTFGFLRLDMRPAHAIHSPPGTWAIEAEFAHQNTWALSRGARDYLDSLPGRRTLGPDEANPEELDASVKAVSSLGVTPLREMAMGRPEHTLVRVAERDEVDLIVVGHRGIGGMTRRLLGSVSEHVAHHAPCSVFVVRPPGTIRG